MATPTKLPAWLEALAASWDGCMHDAPGEMIDIGASIRAAAMDAPNICAGAPHICRDSSEHLNQSSEHLPQAGLAADHETRKRVAKIKRYRAETGCGVRQAIDALYPDGIIPQPATAHPAEGVPVAGDGRTDAEIVERTEAAARFLLGWKYGLEPESSDAQLRHSGNTKAQWAWDAACRLQEIITDSDAVNAAQEVDDGQDAVATPSAPAAQEGQDAPAQAAQARREPLSNQDAETLVRDCDYDPHLVLRVIERRFGITQEKPT
ncbi:MAG: hypothetical protein LBV14_11460 [Acidovorax sp.]|jgi:hypothetical protein|nr:hypothetical protein [Acidovorax sp.]